MKNSEILIPNLVLQGQPPRSAQQSGEDAKGQAEPVGGRASRDGASSRRGSTQDR